MTLTPNFRKALGLGRATARQLAQFIHQGKRLLGRSVNPKDRTTDATFVP